MFQVETIESDLCENMLILSVDDVSHTIYKSGKTSRAGPGPAPISGAGRYAIVGVAAAFERSITLTK